MDLIVVEDIPTRYLDINKKGEIFWMPNLNDKEDWKNIDMICGTPKHSGWTAKKFIKALIAEGYLKEIHNQEI